MYPEFRNRCPPPTYNASAQDYQHHLLMAQIQLAAATVHNTEYIGLPTSPPPTYRSRAATLQRPAGTAPLHQQRPPVDPLPLMAAAPSSSNSSVRPPPPTAAVQPPLGYNNNTLPSTVRVGSHETKKGAAATPETETRCGRCSSGSIPQQPELACQSDASGQQRPKIGGGGGAVVGTTTRDPLLRSWTTDGCEGNSNGCTTGETAGKPNERLP